MDDEIIAPMVDGLSAALVILLLVSVVLMLSGMIHPALPGDVLSVKPYLDKTTLDFESFGDSLDKEVENSDNSKLMALFNQVPGFQFLLDKNEIDFLYIGNVPNAFYSYFKKQLKGSGTKTINITIKAGNKNTAFISFVTFVKNVDTGEQNYIFHYIKSNSTIIKLKWDN